MICQARFTFVTLALSNVIHTALAFTTSSTGLLAASGYALGSDGIVSLEEKEEGFDFMLVIAILVVFVVFFAVAMLCLLCRKSKSSAREENLVLMRDSMRRSASMAMGTGGKKVLGFVSCCSWRH